jgi:hypothetical protein
LRPDGVGLRWTGVTLRLQSVTLWVGDVGLGRGTGIGVLLTAPLAGEGGAPSGAEGEGSAAIAADRAAVPSPNPLPQGERAMGRVLINKDQGFDGVPALAWSFPIGGYQPAQKWLKDRRGHALTYEDLLHYQKIVKILVETDRIMREIELPLETATA